MVSKMGAWGRAALGAAGLQACGVVQAGPWADRVVFGIHEGSPAYEPGVGTPLTYGPFHADPLWNDPASVLGKPNTLDYDDLEGWGPVPGGFAGGPMRRLSLVWSAWQWGSNDPDHLAQRPGWLDGRRRNGLGLRQGAQIVVEFDTAIENNPTTDAVPWGIDLIVHGNAAFIADRGIAASTSMDAAVLTGGVLAEPVEISVAQSIVGPWYRCVRAGDDLFPTNPWRWEGGAWTGEEADWLRPVDPALGAPDFAGLTAGEAIALYGGSAGGTPLDLDELIDDQGAPASLAWARFVRFRDPLGMQGEICGVVDVPGGPPGCNPADLADPRGVLDLADITAFSAAFLGGSADADLALPGGVLDLADITAFIAAFSGGCP
jgi:hypothetical protein